MRKTPTHAVEVISEVIRWLGCLFGSHGSQIAGFDGELALRLFQRQTQLQCFAVLRLLLELLLG